MSTYNGRKVVDSLARQPFIARQAVPTPTDSSNPAPPPKPACAGTGVAALTSFLHDRGLLGVWMGKDQIGCVLRCGHDESGGVSRWHAREDRGVDYEDVVGAVD